MKQVFGARPPLKTILGTILKSIVQQNSCMPRPDISGSLTHEELLANTAYRGAYGSPSG